MPPDIDAPVVIINASGSGGASGITRVIHLKSISSEQESVSSVDDRLTPPPGRAGGQLSFHNEAM